MSRSRTFPYAVAVENCAPLLMPSLSATRSAMPAPAVGWTVPERRAYFAWAVGSVAAITVVRLLWLAVHSPDLYPDEAQYWFWAQYPALGYYSKPPLVAWVIALTTALFGDSEFAVRLAAQDRKSKR